MQQERSWVSAWRIMFLCAAPLIFSFSRLAEAVRELTAQELAHREYVESELNEDKAFSSQDNGRAVADVKEARQHSKNDPECYVSTWEWEYKTFGKAPHKKLTKFVYRYNVTCSADATATIFFSGVRNNTDKKADGMGGIYRKDLDLKAGENELEPLEMMHIDRAFGSRAGKQWVHIQAWTPSASSTNEYFVDVPKVENVDGALWFAGSNAEGGCELKRWKRTWSPTNPPDLKKYELKASILCPTDAHVKVFFSSPLRDYSDPIKDGGVTGVYKEADIPAGTETYLEPVDLLRISKDLTYGIKDQTMWISVRNTNTKQINDRYVNVQALSGDRVLKS